MENQQKCKKEWEKLRISKKWLKTDKIIIILTPINKKIKICDENWKTIKTARKMKNAKIC